MILITNGIVITKNEKNPLIEDGAVLVRENRIEKVGSTQNLLLYCDGLKQKNPSIEIEILDAQRKLVMPGFINCHEHIYSQFARGSEIPKKAPSDFLSVLEGTWWYLDENLSLENVYFSALSAYLESIKNGVTFVNDHHASFGVVKGSLQKIAQAAKLCGVRTCLCYEISERAGKEKTQESIDENFDFCGSVNHKNPADKDAKMINGLVGIHASFTVSDETLIKIKNLNKKNYGYHVHIAEGLYDEQHCEKTYGCSIVERFERLGMLGEKTLAGHCIHISDKDMEILSRTKTIVVHNPESNMANGVGSPDILKMLDYGILTGLGTDGYTHDMTESLKVANILQKNRNLNPGRGFAEAVQLLDNNARIISRMIDDNLGKIEEGFLADLIILDYKPCTPITKENIAGHLMFGISGNMTDTTIVNGKILMKNRKILCVDENSAFESCRKSAEELWRRL